ncbi:MAG: protein kinase, partial [Myxococcota bacterium]
MGEKTDPTTGVADPTDPGDGVESCEDTVSTIEPTVIESNPTEPPEQRPPSLTEHTAVEWNPTNPDTVRQPSSAPQLDILRMPAANVVAPGLVADEMDDGVTVRLDLEQQDKLMQLRAQQDQLLKSRFETDVVIMFTDVVGSMAYYEKYGDLMGRQKMLTHNALLFPIVRSNGGTIVKTIGDSIMACFGDADEALSSATGIQRALRDFNRSAANADEEIHVRIGLNAGSAIAEGGDLHGDAVNTAARVEAWAKGDEILVAAALAESVTDWPLHSLGPVVVKGKRKPLDLFRLQWHEDTTQKVLQPTAGGVPSGFPPRYRLREVIGRGAMGVVYLADDVEQDIRVAIKVLHRYVARDDTAKQTFDTALRAACGLDHENIVHLYGHGETTNGDLYYVAEYLDGINLAQLVARHGCPPLHEMAWIGYHVGAAIDFANTRGIIHGDLKPENVLVNDRGQVKVTDFGLVRLWIDDLARDASPVGSPAFIASELLTGAEWHPRADVYSLGALLYFLVSGQTPVEGGATVQALRAIALGRIRPLIRVKPDLPSEVIAVVDKAVSLDANRRFSSMGVMMTRMRQLVDTPGTDRVESLSRYIDVDTARSTQTQIVTDTRRFFHPSPELRSKLTLAGIVAAAVVTVALGGIILHSALSTPSVNGSGTVITKLPTGRDDIDDVTEPIAPETGADPSSAAAVAVGRHVDVSPAPAPAPKSAIKATAKPKPTPKASAKPPAKPPARAPPTPRRRPSRPRKPASSGIGTLVVATVPWAEVFIDGRSVGRTPHFKTLSLSAG